MAKPGPLSHFLIICFAVAGVLSAVPATALSADREAVDKAIAAVKPALVRIHVAEVDYDQGREVKSEASGSGVIISKDGYIVTNHHVAGWAKTILCTLSNKEQVEADLVGTDPLTDIAVIKLRGSAGSYPTAAWGDSSKLKVGDPVLAMGCPLALSQSVTEGVVSNTEMIMPDYMAGEMTIDGEDVGSMVKWIGHDAAIFPGNSGGPLVNENGEIIGINEINLGLSGAIPSNIASRIADELIKSGKVKRAWIGVGVQPLLKSSKLDKGVLVSGVIPAGPAKAAGMKSGDVITKVAGTDVTVKFAEQMPEFNRMVAALPIGQPSEFTVLRSGAEVPIKITPKDRPEAEPKQKELKQWGACCANLSFVEAQEMKRPNQDGVLVTSLRPGAGCADAKPCLEEGDVITAIAGKPVKGVADLAALTDGLTAGKTAPTPVLVAFDRDNEHMLTVVKVGVQEMEDPGKEVRKAYLPIKVQVLTADLATALGVPGKSGVRVTQVFPNSAAAQAGLKVGDLIVSVDGSPVEATQPEDEEVLPAMIRQYKIGSKATLSIIRDKEPVKVTVTLPESPLLPREMRRYKETDFEFAVRDIANSDRMDTSIDKDATGVLVEEVTQGGWAALGRLESGDIVWEVDGQPVSKVSEMKAAMEKIRAAKPEIVVMRVRRGLQELYIEMDADWDGTK